MGKYNDLLEPIFEEWRKESAGSFVKDGIWQKNDERIKVEEAWESADRRVLFLLKDQNQEGSERRKGMHQGQLFLLKDQNQEGSGWIEDSRTWLVGDGDNQRKNRNLQGRFIHNIAYIFYGLWNAHRDNPCRYSNDELKARSGDLYDSVRECFNTQPFAFMETKKTGGGSSLSNNALKSYINSHKDLLEREIKALNPNILVCTSYIIYDFAQSLYPRENGGSLISFGEKHNSVKYHPEKDVLFLCSYHPSAVMKYQTVYEGVMDHFRAFLDSEWADGSRLK